MIQDRRPQEPAQAHGCAIRPMAVEKDWNAEACLNCGDPHPGRFCPACGQRKGPIRVSLRRLLSEVLEDQLSINAALPRTLGALFFRPGRLTADYLRGRIAAYIAPFRLYLVSSLLFFLVLSFTSRVTSGDFENLQREANAAGAALDSTGAGDTTTVEIRSAGGRFGLWITPDSAGNIGDNWTRNAQINTGIARLDSLLLLRIRRLGDLPPDQALQQLFSDALKRAPTAMFILLPIFALMLKGLYLRSKRYYVEHFIFALHYHAFAFLLFTLMLLLENTPVSPVFLVWLGIYLPVALRHVYRQGWIKTVFKWGVLSMSYLIVLLLAMFGTLVAALLLS
jgi:hypothetical protein